MEEISREQARCFLLLKNGLLGSRRFSGKQGAAAYVRQAGCVQFDPIDVCGRSHELALLARVKGFSREMLAELLYQDRTLMDYFDKNMCILCTEDWPMLAFLRESFRRNTRSSERVNPVARQVLSEVHAAGSLSAQELDLKEKVDWPWGATSLGRAALETLYFRGELVVHHKTGTVKSYALAADCLPQSLLNAPYPFENELERISWQIKRRIGAVGMLWNAPSDAWLGVNGLNAQLRQAAFDLLMQREQVFPVQVRGVTRPLYLLSQDRALLKECETPFSMEKKVRLLPPLDAMLWDRRLIAALFDFSYKWEVYTPQQERRYGYYVLPVLYGERFAGRVEPVTDREGGVLEIRAFWPEPGVRLTDRFLWEMEDALRQLARFLALKGLKWRENWMREALQTAAPQGKPTNFANH